MSSTPPTDAVDENPQEAGPASQKLKPGGVDEPR
jgi:hypothetical protein